MIANVRRLARTLRSYPSAELIFAGKAFLLAPIVEASLRVFGLRQTVRGIDWLTDGRPARAAITTHRASELVGSVYKRHLVSGTCLPRSLVQYSLQRWDGRSVELAIGIKPPKGRTLAAHAWVRDRGAGADAVESPRGRADDGFLPLGGPGE
jgi:hypothetical protein